MDENSITKKDLKETWNYFRLKLHPDHNQN